MGYVVSNQEIIEFGDYALSGMETYTITKYSSKEFSFCKLFGHVFHLERIKREKNKK